MSERSDESARADAYAAGLRFAADVAHAEARWQTELEMRTPAILGNERQRHRYAAERATEVEKAIRSVSRVGEQEQGGART